MCVPVLQTMAELKSKRETTQQQKGPSVSADTHRDTSDGDGAQPMAATATQLTSALKTDREPAGSSGESGNEDPPSAKKLKGTIICVPHTDTHTIATCTVYQCVIHVYYTVQERVVYMWVDFLFTVTFSDVVEVKTTTTTITPQTTTTAMEDSRYVYSYQYLKSLSHTLSLSL